MISKYGQCALVVGAMVWMNSGSAAVEWQPAQLKHAQEATLHSPETGRDYRIQVAALGDAAAEGYPVLYLLDGDAMMPAATMMVQSMMMGPNAARDGVLLVAIGYPDADPLNLPARAKDYTPPSPDNNQHHGGAPAFHEFMTETLKPTIEQRYTVDKGKQAIMGHSYGGLYGLYNLFNYPQDFQYYIISSPSIWFGKQVVLQDENKLTAPPQYIRLSAAEYEQSPNPKMPADPAHDKRKQQRKMVSNTEALARRLQQRFPDAAIEQQTYAGETHGSVIPRSLYDGIEAWLDQAAPISVQ